MCMLLISNGDPAGSAIQGVGQRPLGFWCCGFEFHLGHGCLSVASVVCRQVDVSAAGRSLEQRNPTKE
jgi:hypothetical protein